VLVPSVVVKARRSGVPSLDATDWYPSANGSGPAGLHIRVQLEGDVVAKPGNITTSVSALVKAEKLPVAPAPTYAGL
jgi:hypothetical protein